MPKKKNASTNAAEALYQKLKEGIQHGRWKVGERMPTIDEIDQGALKEGPEINDLRATRYNARVAISRLAREGFVKPRGKAGTIVIKSPSAMERPRLVALITPARSEFVSKLIIGITNELQARSSGRDISQRYRLICLNAGATVDMELALANELAEEADALLILPTPAKDDDDHKKRVEALCRIHKPIWLIAASINDGPLRYSGEVIAYPETTIARRVADFVDKLDRRPTHVFVGGEDHLKALRERAEGIEDRLVKECKFDVAEVTRLRPNNGFNGTPQALGERYAKEVVERSEKLGRPVLVICTTDLVAFGVLHGLRKAGPGFAVPNNVMVMGIDNDDSASYCNPTLTSLPLDPILLGQAVVGRVVAKLETNSVPEPPDLDPAIGIEPISRESAQKARCGKI